MDKWTCIALCAFMIAVGAGGWSSNQASAKVAENQAQLAIARIELAKACYAAAAVNQNILCVHLDEKKEVK